MKTTIFCLLGGLLMPFLLQAQIDQASIGSLGGEISNSKVSLIQSIGDVAGSQIGVDPELIQGFVQFFNCDDCGKGSGDNIEDAYLHPQVQLFPNPTNGEFRFEGPDQLLHRYTIHNAQGQQLAGAILNSKTVNHSELAAGMYLLRTYARDGKLSAVMKLIKH
jgi:hypothetical protein